MAGAIFVFQKNEYVLYVCGMYMHYISTITYVYDMYMNKHHLTFHLLNQMHILVR